MLERVTKWAIDPIDLDLVGEPVESTICFDFTCELVACPSIIPFNARVGLNPRESAIFRCNEFSSEWEF